MNYPVAVALNATVFLILGSFFAGVKLLTHLIAIFGWLPAVKDPLTASTKTLLDFQLVRTVTPGQVHFVHIFQTLKYKCYRRLNKLSQL